MYLNDPTFFESIKTILPVIGWGTIITAIGLATRWAWKVRGAVDDFLTSQVADRVLAQRTLDGVEAAKKAAMDEVASAKQHGEIRADELKKGIETLDTNHLAHIQTDIAEINVKHDRLIGIGTKQLELSQSIKEGIAVLVALQQAKKD